MSLLKLSTPDLKEFPRFLKTIESKWKTKLMRRFDRECYVLSKNHSIDAKHDLNNETIPPRYILSMFPYPSGKLHLGHARIYTSGDVLTRFSRMLNKHENYVKEFDNVITPMGFDSFGLPAENAARERGLNPASWTNSNIRVMKKQMDDLSLQFNWREATSNPSYYKWTQELFLKLMDSNLVYKSFAKVNWDPVDKTVLADEQVDEDGRSWRSGAKVEKRYFRQWFVKVNAFVDAIYEANEVEPESWRDVLAIQKNWVGVPSGWIFYLPVSRGSDPDILPIFTDKPELFTTNGASLILSKDHWLETVKEISNAGHIENPFTGQKLKVIISDGTSELPTNCNATLSVEGDSTSTDMIKRQQIMLQARISGFGGYRTSNKYRDWLVSRQRYCGNPIPVIKCDSCGYQGVSREDLPVVLPKIENSKIVENYNKKDDFGNDTDEFKISTPIDKLAPKEWLVTDCPSCESKESKAIRESETLDTLFDSSWYFLRYSSNPDNSRMFDPDRVQPVWCYIGGLEHACMHLFYARFMTHFLHSLGELKFKEPFKKLLVQGVVKSKTYKVDGKYLSSEETDSIQDKSSLEVKYEKMSKSKGNGVDPENLLEDYGIDATRFCLMSYANPRSERLWRTNDEEFKDVLIYLRRVVLTVQEYCDIGQRMKSIDGVSKSTIKELSPEELEEKKLAIMAKRNKCCRKAMFYLQDALQFRQFISELHVLLNLLRANITTSVVYSKEFATIMADLIVMLSPMTPHFSEELWQHFCNCILNPLRQPTTAIDKQIYNTALQACDQPWPIAD